jgi:hypothetical protein
MNNIPTSNFTPLDKILKGKKKVRFADIEAGQGEDMSKSEPFLTKTCSFFGDIFYAMLDSSFIFVGVLTLLLTQDRLATMFPDFANEGRLSTKGMLYAALLLTALLFGLKLIFALKRTIVG